MGDIPDFPIEEVALREPPAPEPIRYFGPSSLAIIRKGPKDNRRTCYIASLFVGGKGLAVDGQWGQDFEFSFEVPDGEQVIPVPAAAALLLSKYRPTMTKAWGGPSAEIIIHALGKIVQGHHFTKAMTAEEYMETMW